MKNENKIQQEIFMYYHNNFCLSDSGNIIFSVPNEGKDAKEQAYKKSLGMISGVSDMILIRNNEVIFVEVKTETGKQSENQIKFQKKVELLGFRYIVVRNIEDFIEKIRLN